VPEVPQEAAQVATNVFKILGKPIMNGNTLYLFFKKVDA
jgi:hypothetical protein